jgi:hypothetical protein
MGPLLVWSPWGDWRLSCFRLMHDKYLISTDNILFMSLALNSQDSLPYKKVCSTAAL